MSLRELGESKIKIGNPVTVMGMSVHNDVLCVACQCSYM